MPVLLSEDVENRNDPAIEIGVLRDFYHYWQILEAANADGSYVTQDTYNLRIAMDNVREFDGLPRLFDEKGEKALSRGDN